MVVLPLVFWELSVDASVVFGAMTMSPPQAPSMIEAVETTMAFPRGLMHKTSGETGDGLVLTNFADGDVNRFGARRAVLWEGCMTLVLQKP